MTHDESRIPAPLGRGVVKRPQVRPPTTPQYADGFSITAPSAEVKAAPGSGRT